MYGDSQALSSDSSSAHIFPYNSTPKQDLEKNIEHKFMFMESDSSTGYSQTNSGLLRFRSAPSSLLENYANGDKKERQGSRFCSDEENRMHEVMDSSNGVCRNASMNPQLPPQYLKQNGGQFGYLSMNSMGNMDHQEQGKTGSGLMRQNSSPAGLFSHLSSQSGYVATTGNGDNSPFSNRNFTSEMAPSLGMLSRINEIGNENVGASGLDEATVGNNSGDHLFYNPGYEFGSWNGNSPPFGENFSVGIKRELNNDQQLNGVTQNREAENRLHMLTHHLSLPKTSVEMANLLHLQDSVPCKIRAKRGCATHPRSIAERVRRTRISERMRKLQDLVPNMDKQTNTADMLDLAVEYIKNLQKEYKTLSEKRANCKCLASQKTRLSQ